MFGSPKPMGSLSSGLLARKGQARPAMRPQGFGGFGGVTQGLDDLGWNDMGGREAATTVQPAPAAPQQAAVPPAAAPLAPAAVALTPPVVESTVAAPVAAAPIDAGDGVIPLVLVEREALKASVEAPAAVKSVSLPTAARLRRETQHAGKAAFTLRVDADRHLRLRIAAAITNRSAQDLVTQGLDALLAAIPEVEALVSQLPRAPAARKTAK